MNRNQLYAILACVFVCGQIIQAEDMDTAITKFADDIAKRIQDSGGKKVTVLDFTDLQDNTTELGKYVAEQLTVDFGLAKRSFSVLDRANFKTNFGRAKVERFRPDKP